MDPFQLLKKDHRLVEELFKKIEKSADSKKEDLFSELKNELDTHTRIEETIFYPALKKQEETKETVLEALEEHKGAKTLLQEISESSVEDETWDAKIKVLKEQIEHHVEEEEGEMFKKARAAFSQDELDDLGDQLQAEKENISGEGASTRSSARVSAKRSSATSKSENTEVSKRSTRKKK